MNYYRREAAPETARDLADGLRAVGANLPADVQARLADLDAIDARKPDLVEHADLIDAYLDGADDDTVDALLAAHVGESARRKAWSEARIKSGQRVLAALTANANDITHALAAKAEPLIEQLRQAAAVDTHDLAALLRHNRDDEATLVAQVGVVASDLARLYTLRNKVCRDAEWATFTTLGGDVMSCATWKDPRPAKTGATPTTDPLDGFMHGLRNGAELWFPTPAEAAEAARPIAAEENAQIRARKAEQWGVGSYVA